MYFDRSAHIDREGEEKWKLFDRRWCCSWWWSSSSSIWIIERMNFSMTLNFVPIVWSIRSKNVFYICSMRVWLISIIAAKKKSNLCSRKVDTIILSKILTVPQPVQNGLDAIKVIVGQVVLELFHPLMDLNGVTQQIHQEKFRVRSMMIVMDVGDVQVPVLSNLILHRINMSFCWKKYDSMFVLFSFKG